MTQQTFGEEVKDRAAEQSPAWGIPRLGMTQVMLANQEDFRRRVHDAHRAAQIAQGAPDPGEYVPMGDFHVQGDTNNITHNHFPAPAEPPAKKPDEEQRIVPASPSPAPVSAVNTTEKITTEKESGGWKAAALVGLGLLAGAGLPMAGWALNHWANHPPAPAVSVDTDSDTITEIDFP